MSNNFPIIKGGFEEAFFLKKEIYLPIDISDTIKFVYASEIIDVDTIDFDNLFGTDNLMDNAKTINADAVLNFTIDAHVKQVNSNDPNDYLLLVSGTPVKKCDTYLDTFLDIADPMSSFRSYTPEFMVVKGGSLELFLRTKCLYLPIDTNINHDLVSASEKMEIDMSGKNCSPFIIRTDNLINAAKAAYGADAIAHFSVDAVLQSIDPYSNLFKIYVSGIPMKLIDSGSFNTKPYTDALAKYLRPNDEGSDSGGDDLFDILRQLSDPDCLKKKIRNPRPITYE